MKKLELGESLPMRRQKLVDLVQGDITSRHRVYFQQASKDIPLFKVPIGFPKYRLKNGRTLAAQAEHLASDGKIPADLFRKDEEAIEAQSAQHKILLKMVDEKGLLATLRKQGQREPIILDSNGFVVNGNRRLCAMRKLHIEDVRDFSSIEIALLPAATDEEISDLEISLQVAPDVKADYKWYTLGMMLRIQQQDFQHDIGTIAKTFHMKNSDVERSIAMLLVGENYLAKRQKKGLYHLLDGREFAFKQIIECRKKFGGDDLATSAFEQMAFGVTDSPEGDRAYAQIPKIHAHFQPILKKLGESGLIEKSGAQPTGTSATALLGDDDGATKPDEINPFLNGVVSALDDPNKRSAITQCVVNAIALEDERQEDLHEATYVQKRLEKANTALADAIAGWGENTITEGLGELLNTIDESVTALREKLKQ